MPVKVTISQFSPPRALPTPLAAVIEDPAVAAVVDVREPPPGGPAAPVPLVWPGVLAASAPGRPPVAGDDKLAAAAFEAAGLAPKSARLFPGFLALAPLEAQVAMRASLVQLDKEAQETLGKPAFDAGMFVIGAPEQVAKLADGALGATARLAAGGRLASDALAALGSFVPGLASNASVLGDGLMLATVPEEVSRLLDPEEPRLKRLTAGGRLVATGLSLAAHFVPMLAPYGQHFRTVSWVCKLGDKVIIATAEAAKRPGAA